MLVAIIILWRRIFDARSDANNSRDARIDGRPRKMDRCREPVEVGSGLIKPPVTYIPGEVQNDIRTYLVDYPANGAWIK